MDDALYRAVLADPHDDTPRLVLADWLDEYAAELPPVPGRSARARAEFIRVQCAVARAGPDPALLRRQRRLLFTHGPKWRRGVPAFLASAPFDRGFLRPRRAVTPARFLSAAESFRHAPLWDVHLYASDWFDDPGADRGQYGRLLAEVGRSPALERVGWLQVSFFVTPAVEFLRTGQFPNVETLVLNCGPFPEVLGAVAENPSFRSLRYVRLGPDRWAWAAAWAAGQHLLALEPGLEAANRRHLRYGEMPAALRALLGGAATLPEMPAVAPGPDLDDAPMVGRYVPYPTAEMPVGRFLASVGLAVCVPVAVLLAASLSRWPSNTTPALDVDVDKMRRNLEPIPPLDPAEFRLAPPAKAGDG